MCKRQRYLRTGYTRKQTLVRAAVRLCGPRRHRKEASENGSDKGVGQGRREVHMHAQGKKSSLGLGRLVPGEREHAIKGLLGATDLGRAKENHRMAFDLSIIFGWPRKDNLSSHFSPNVPEGTCSFYSEG